MGRRVDDEMDEEEMRLHIQNRAEDLERAGVPRAEAERRARIEFGGVERFKEEVRDVRWETRIENVFRDFRYAVRSLWKDKRFAGVAVFALALGIGASTVVFSVFYNLLFHAFAAKDAGRLVVPVVEDMERPESSSGLWIRLQDLTYLREHNQVFEGVFGRHYGRTFVRYGTRTFQFYNAMVTANAFEVYGARPLLGRGIVSEDGRAGAPKTFVMSYDTWKDEFGGDAAVVGKSFVVGDEARTLVGVMQERFHGLGTWDIYTPVSWAVDPKEALNAPKYYVMARLKRGATLAAASAEFEVIAKQLAAMHPKDGDYPKKFVAKVVGANDYLMASSGAGTIYLSKGNLKRVLYDLLAAVLVLLLIACSNVANLLLGRATTREKEIAVRSALGASRWQIMRQLLMESFVLALCACAGGSALAWIAMRAVDAAIHQRAWENIRGEAVIGLNMAVLFFAAGITFLTTLMCGLVPALRATKRDLQSQLVGSAKGEGGGFRHGKVRAGLVMSQVALSIVLLVGAGLMMRSLYRLTHVDLGFNPKNILVVGIAPARSSDQLPDRALMASTLGHEHFQRALENIRALPGVASVAVNNVFPGYGPSRGPRVAAVGDTRDVEAGMDECDENCLGTLEMRMTAGRWLSRDEVQTRRFAAVINETLMHALFGDKNPVGQQLEVRDFKHYFSRSSGDLPEKGIFEIVGVVRDTKNAGPQGAVVPMAFIPPMITGDFLVQVKTKVEPRSMMHAVQEAVWAADRGEVFWVLDPLTEFLEESTYATPEFGVSLSGPLAGIALVLVVIGVFSVMAYTVSLRTREIGVRMALGAQRGEILRTVLGKGFVLLAVGIFIGVFASYGLTRFLKSQIWGVSATDPWTFGAVVGLVVVTGLAACWFPARRAASVDPLVALRYE
jgi:putative ABC transport system permease protein